MGYLECQECLENREKLEKMAVMGRMELQVFLDPQVHQVEEGFLEHPAQKETKEIQQSQ